MTHLSRLRILSASVLLVSSLLLATGCGDSGPPRAGAEGTVTFDGAPIDGGRIMFIAADKKGGANAHADIKDGKYALPIGKGPSPGGHRVEIVWFKKTGKQIVGSDPPNLVDEKIQVLPKNYNTASTLSADIKSGKNTVNFDLKAR